MAVNEPSLRVQSEDEVCLRSHNSLETSQSLIYLLLEAIGPGTMQRNLIVKVAHSISSNKKLVKWREP